MTSAPASSRIQFLYPTPTGNVFILMHRVDVPGGVEDRAKVGTAFSPRPLRARVGSVLVRPGSAMERVPVVDTGAVHPSVQAVVRGLEGGAQRAVSPGLGARRERVDVGDRALDLIEHRARVG